MVIYVKYYFMFLTVNILRLQTPLGLLDPNNGLVNKRKLATFFDQLINKIVTNLVDVSVIANIAHKTKSIGLRGTYPDDPEISLDLS